ncbi:translesion DNA synthesis-associated protein ImuA [Azoarcus indigens]|uniref:SOS cell division inhibitor SulA n=1 Tax=Azoarcus indigens TaxID=29545 RepID=A0A4R6DRW7_9RHOO|nr:translesion DNA synthesis-associated protein ImuA [Azoarcus indigens]NMG66880.1 translesion DNA synthesis-associated protein ImuA [Azoarcus indigens]TDN47239.1 SOS cell division inhibitor SulA [Azoarcus indigens]
MGLALARSASANPTVDVAGRLATGLVWQASRMARGSGPVRPTGFAALDAELPGGGWPASALIELLVAQPGCGELGLLLPLLRQTPDDRWLAWIAPPFIPYAPALAAAGVPLSRLLLITPSSAGEILWATRQAVASAACAAVLCWPQRADTAALRRLQLAAEESATPLFLFRPENAARQSSPASLRLALSPAGKHLRVDILKRRGPPTAAPLLLPLRGDDLAVPPSDVMARPDPAPAALAGLCSR